MPDDTDPPTPSDEAPSRDSAQTRSGQLAIDCSELEPFLEDLAAGSLAGMRTRQPGYRKVFIEIISNQDSFGSRAGITDTDIKELMLADERIAMIDRHLPAVSKLAEMLTETRAKLDDRSQRLISMIARSVEMRADTYDDKELLARYEKTSNYRSAIANKSARTRRKNAKAKAAKLDKPDKPDKPDPDE